MRLFIRVAVFIVLKIIVMSHFFLAFFFRFVIPTLFEIFHRVAFRFFLKNQHCVMPFYFFLALFFVFAFLYH